MAALARSTPGGPFPMATSDANTNKILTAIEDGKKENRDAHEKNREAIGTVTLTVAQLSADVGHMGEAITELRTTVGSLDKEKVSRAEVGAIEERLERGLDQYRVQNKIDFDQYRVQSRIDFEQYGKQVDARFENVNKFKIDKSEMNPGTIDDVLERLGHVEQKAEDNEKKIKTWEDRAEGGWTVLAKIGLVLSALVSSVAFLIHEFLAIGSKR